MMALITCELCKKPATYMIEAVEVAGQPHNGTPHYYCDEHYDETIKEMEA